MPPTIHWLFYQIHRAGTLWGYKGIRFHRTYTSLRRKRTQKHPSPYLVRSNPHFLSLLHSKRLHNYSLPQTTSLLATHLIDYGRLFYIIPLFLKFRNKYYVQQVKIFGMHAKLTLIWLQSLIEITILIINFVVAFAGAISSKRTNNNTVEACK